ncbi:MAG: energy-coupling factor transporter transmembrane protein EcfT [Candidatus Glassbacteria bacterium]|nr:energy-coupling factor transporter transmembrane protein EcfT [Candidatus Glassbacteria bacterium]
MRDISRGRYFPGKSPAHLLDPRLKVLMVGLLSVAVWYVDSFTGLGLLGLLLAGWTLLGQGFFPRMLLSLRSLVYIVLAVLIYYLFSGVPHPGGGWAAGLIAAALFCGKVALLWLAATWMTLSTAPLKLAEALGHLLRPLEYMRLPVRELSFTVGLVLRFFPDSVARIGNIHRQLKIRECLAVPDGRPVKKPLRTLGRVIDAMSLYMHYSLYESEMLALSLIARGYNPFRASFPVSLAPPGTWQLGLALLSAFLILFCAWRL